MNQIVIGLSKPKIWYSFLLKPSIFIKVPVARSICISSYLLQIDASGTSFRLADKFFDTNSVIFSKALRVSHKKELAIIDWGRVSTSGHTTGALVDDVFRGIFGFLIPKGFSTKNPHNLRRILRSIGEEKVKFAWQNYVKR